METPGNESSKNAQTARLMEKKKKNIFVRRPRLPKGAETDNPLEVFDYFLKKAQKNMYAFYKKQEAKAWEKEAGYQIIQQWKGRRIPIKSNVALIIDWFYGKKDRDIDAGIKILLDLLEKQQVYLNDIQVTEMTVRKHFDILEPRVEVEIIQEPREGVV